MSTEALDNNILGKMFNPFERSLLRGRKREHREAKAHQIVRLASTLACRRSPRDGCTLPIDCFKKAGLDEDVDMSRRQLPKLSVAEVGKAYEATYEAEVRIGTQATRTSSGLRVGELEPILREAQARWTKDGRDESLAAIIDSIPEKNKIYKIICVGLSEIATRYGRAPNEIEVKSKNLAQHLAVASMARYLRTLVSHQVELSAADWSYDREHVRALRCLGIEVLNASCGFHEHMVEIDDYTLVVCFGIEDCESIIPIISEYARPVAMIYDAYEYQITEGHPQPIPSPVWSKVMYKGDWVSVPGPPFVARATATGPSTTEQSNGRPFYTVSTGRMLQKYKMAMNLFEFDVSSLTSQFELHSLKDSRLNTDSENKELSETEQRRFANRRSRLFVRIPKR
ncbi:hypothetical protein F4678DRAFT_457885 [Xylaria arbuscula]|nr:hypothetical protein F4678DRAFT_457885 [Xylaria arbuscula]